MSNVFAGFVIVLGNPTHLYPDLYVDAVEWHLLAKATVVYTTYWSNPNETWFAGGMPPSVFQPIFTSDGVSVLAAQGTVASSL